MRQRRRSAGMSAQIQTMVNTDATDRLGHGVTEKMP
jgi:hypothetical protein